MENLINQHLEAFGVEPYIIGMYWNDLKTLEDNIVRAIKDNKPYNEYDLLSDEEKKAFDDGSLLF